jgi:PIN domain nuclease of toxin-antitoxin system
MRGSGRDVLHHFNQAGYRILYIEPERALAIEELSLHHQEPSDRLLIAQAVVEPMRLTTHDRAIASYNDTIFIFYI